MTPVIVPPGPPTTFSGELLEAMAPWLNPAHENYLLALGQMFEDVSTLVMDRGNDGDPGYVPGWGVLFDVDLCPPQYLGYLAQFVGVVVPVGTDAATARQIIRAEAGWQRGTPGAIINAAKRNLSGTQSVTLLERTAADGITDAAWHFVIVVLVSEVVSAAQLTIDVDNVRPGGVMWTLIQTTGFTYAQALNTYSVDAFSWRKSKASQP